MQRAVSRSSTQAQREVASPLGILTHTCEQPIATRTTRSMALPRLPGCRHVRLEALPQVLKLAAVEFVRMVPDHDEAQERQQALAC